MTFVSGQQGHVTEHNHLLAFGYNVKRYGAAGNGSTDDTSAIQAAIDAAAATSHPGATVVLPPGNYSITSTLQWKSCDIIGLGSPNNGVTITWNGSAEGTAVQRTAATGAVSFGRLSNVRLASGSTEPGIWLDLTAAIVDALFQLERVQFSGSTIAAIDVGSWVNAHWRNLRFDNCGEWPIRLGPTGPQFLSSFVLDQFTYDHHREDNAGQGVVRVDNSNNSANLGTLTLRGGRIELNEEWSGDNAIFSMKVPDSSPNARSCGFRLDDVTFQDVTGTSSPSVMHRETASSTGSESLMLTNFRQSGIASDALVSGTWPGALSIPTLDPNTGVLAFNQSS